MVICAIVGCGTRSVRGKGVYMARMPSIITNQGEEMRKLTDERRKAWISAISRRYLTDSIMKNSRICSNHFVSGRAADPMKRHDPDWVPSLNLGHKKHLSGEELPANLEKSAKRKLRVVERATK